jgi:hypothetical protein
MTYGYRVKNGTDELVKTVEHMMNNFNKAIAFGSHLVDVFHWREYYKLDGQPSYV